MRRLRAEHVTKVYPGVVALNDVSVCFESGKIHAFVGKNGSGKSTLLKIFSGAIPKDAGKVFLDDVELSCQTPMDASRCGLATVYQELSVVEGVSVAENIFMNRLARKRTGLVDWKKTYEMADALLGSLGIALNSRTMVDQLSISERQMVEIAKAMSQNPKVLALDEPTSALSQSEVNTLFGLLRRLKEQDVIIIYVSHRLQELWEIADTCTVLRDGEYIGTRELKQAGRQDILHMMFGSVQVETRPDDLTVDDEVALQVRGLCRANQFKDVTFDLKKGEILGIAGMLGSGRTELLRCIFGADPFDSGHISVFGRSVPSPNTKLMRNLGVGMVQEDRQRDGIIALGSISMNMTLATIDQTGPGLLYDRRQAQTCVDRQVGALNIKLASAQDNMNSLSGGNQQKVIVGRWLNTHPRIILFDEPSRGIDVAAKQQIFRIIWELSRNGISSIVVSSELEELIEVCTRILIMRGGRLEGEADPDEMTIDKLYLKCMGE